MPSGIYAIYGPNAKVYIGSSADIRNRWASHRAALNRGTHCNQWLQRAWQKHGADAFSFWILEEVPPIELLIREQFYLDAGFALDPCPLYNTCRIAGNTQGVRPSEEVRRKMSAAGKRRAARDGTRSPDETTRQRMSASARRRVQTEAGRAHIERLARLPRVHVFTEETRRKISEGLRGRPYSEATRQKMSASLRGKKRSAEDRAKMSASRKGRKNKPEATEAMIISQTGGRRCTAIAPDGTVYKDILNIAAFEGEHGLRKGAMYSVFNGKTKQYKGWRGFIQPPEADVPPSETDAHQ